MISKLYKIISNKLWNLFLYFGDLYYRWVLASQQKALGPCKCAQLRAMLTYRNDSLSPSRKKSIFVKIRGHFSFKFFQGHNWLTYYPESEFHGHWKTVTLSPISPNLSKHWRFLAFWLSLCFGSFLLFRVCRDTAFLFSTRAMFNECIRKSAKRGHCTRAEQECCIMTDSKRLTNP